MFRFFILVLADVLRIPHGQSLKKVFIDSVFYLFYLLSTSFIDNSNINHVNVMIPSFLKSPFLKINLCFNFILIIVISETFCWLFKNGPINQQALAAIDFRQLLNYFSTYYI